MKRFFFLVLCIPFFVSAQDNPLLIEGASPNLYVSHTVAPKENYYSIGRLYNISPKEIAPFNKIKLEKGLTPGQVLKIPMVNANFSQKNKAGNGETLVPVYYTVKERDGLYRISINHNKVPVETLKKWNNLNSDKVNIGENLVVGYLKVKTGQSELAAKAVFPLDKKVKLQDGATEPEKIPAQKELPPMKKESEKEVKQEKPVTKNEAPVTSNENIPGKPLNETAIDFRGGVFKSLFDSQTSGNELIHEEGAAGVFKSTSGWKDGKYYCLHNTAPAGSVIRVTNPANGKVIYAKVLDLIPDIRQNNSVLIRISNAAAATLEAGEEHFNCSLDYTK